MDDKQFTELMQVQRALLGTLTDIKFELVNARLSRQQSDLTYQIPLAGAHGRKEGDPEDVRH